MDGAEVFKDAVRAGQLSDGDRVFLSGFGAGRYRCLRRDHGGDFLAGVPGPCSLRIELTVEAAFT
jgi:hypothetical protein